jgi:hypothetical protein
MIIPRSIFAIIDTGLAGLEPLLVARGCPALELTARHVHRNGLNERTQPQLHATE